MPARTQDSPVAGPVGEAPRRPWRAAAAVLSGVAGLALLVAAENLEAGRIFNFTLRYPGTDKLAHVGQYALVFLATWWLLGALAMGRLARAAAGVAIATVLGAGDELFQRFVAHRSFEFADLAANVLGVVLGVGLGPVLPSRRMARSLVAAGVVGAVALATQSYLQLRHFNRGLLYTRQGDLPNALTQYRLALRDGLDSSSFFNELAWIEVESGVGDPHAAVAYAARSLAANPRSPDVLDTYAWALHHTGRSREALPLLERAFADKPQMFCIHYHLAEVYAALGDPVRAERHLREQIRRFPDSREARRAAQSLRRRGLATITPAG